jgi:serine/threonine protein kinase
MKADALIGTVLGTCTLQKIIGQGGMGAVFLAQQSRPRRQVAVKVLLPATSLKPHQRSAFLERFRRETDAAASLEHPNILPVHEYGERDGLAYLVVPYISGGTLRDSMEQEGPLPLPKVLNYLEQMAAALDFAHERGVIHRDIKPANILMTPEGRLLLTDFGLVKIIADGQTPQMRLTGAGAPVGTPDYMSPEQVIGEVVDGRSDLYSLGVLLYQMVTGTTPFHGETPMQIAAQQMQTPPSSPRLLRADLPVATERVMLRAMAKRPADRYPTGQDLVDAFRGSLVSSGVSLGNTVSGPLAGGTSTSARLFTPKGLFDPTWQTGAMGTIPSAPSALSQRTGILPVASAEEARPSGLLSRTGMFPKVGATGQLSPVTGMLPATTGVQPAAIDQLSPERHTTGILPVPGTGQAAENTANTVKLTGPVKVVQVPVAGQPGQYVTRLLPVVAQPQKAAQEQLDTAKGNRKKFWQVLVTALVLLIFLSSGASYWYLRSHTTQGAHHSGVTATHPVGTPNVKATATAQVQATVDANQILTDPLSHNIHNLPTGPNEFFADGAYHIFNTQANAVAVVLPEQPFTIPNAYTLTMWEVKGDDTSNNNSFGMILRFGQQTKNGKTNTTFYSFEVVNVAGGEYRFYKYDDSAGSTDPAKNWTQLWHRAFGTEFHQGQGSKHVNTIRIYQNGSSFTFTVNGKMIGTAHDSSLKSGTLGMLVNLKGTEVAFKNMLITHN